MTGSSEEEQVMIEAPLRTVAYLEAIILRSLLRNLLGFDFVEFTILASRNESRGVNTAGMHLVYFRRISDLKSTMSLANMGESRRNEKNAPFKELLVCSMLPPTHSSCLRLQTPQAC